MQIILSPVEEREQGIGRRKSCEISISAIFSIAVERQVSKFQTKTLGRLKKKKNVPCSHREPPTTETNRKAKAKGTIVSGQLGTHSGSETDPSATWRVFYFWPLVDLKFLSKATVG